MIHNTIHNEDCIDGISSIRDSSVDLILTDPPYLSTNLKFDKDGFDHKIFDELKRVLKPNGWFFCFANFDLACTITRDYNWRKKFEYVWIKSNPIMKTKNARHPRHIHEFLFAFIRPDLKKMTDLYMDEIALRTRGERYHRPAHKRRPTEFHASSPISMPYKTEIRNPGYREGTTVLQYNGKNCMKRSERTAHPTQKPLDLCRLVVRAYCPQGGTVLDPFAGSGTSLVAAQTTNRKYLGYEIDKKYHAIAESRLVMHLEAYLK